MQERESAQILAAIDDTRNDMNQTVQELRQRVQPLRMIRSAGHALQSAVERAPAASVLGALLVGGVLGLLTARRMGNR